MKIASKKQKTIVLSILLAAIIIATGILVPMVVQGEEFNDENPELTLEKIDSDLEAEYYNTSPYMQNSTLTQGGGKYKITTNSMAVWRYNDDVAFAYKKYNVKGSGSDYIDIEVTVNEMPSGTPTTHHNASCGIMLRSSLDPAAAEVFLHVRPLGILAVYRSNDGNITLKQQPGLTPTFPLTLKMHKQGQKVTMSFIGSNGVEVDFPYPVQMSAAGPIYAGIASHSCDVSSTTTANFTNLKISGKGTYVDGGDNKDESSSASSEYVEEDSPLASNILLRETFTDGDLYNAPESKANPVWSKDMNGSQIVNKDGNRYWDLSFVDTVNYAGDQSMTDYEVSADFQFTPECNPDIEAGSNTLRLYARHTDIPFYGNSDYSAVITEGYKVSLYKRSYLGDTVDASGYLLGETVNLREVYGDEDFTLLGDNKWHTLKLSVFDNKIKIYLDGELFIDFVDTGIEESDHGKRVFGKGNIGVSAYETAVLVDNITVKKLDDSFGGDYDNGLGGNWDQPVPDYVNEYNEKF